MERECLMTYLTCNLCDEPITFDTEHVSEKTGKKIPLDFTHEPHECEVWRQQQEQRRKMQRKYHPCKKGCGKQIYFDGSSEYGFSESGKYIPLDKQTGEPHQCD